jgi:hypothetical protein
MTRDMESIDLPLNENFGFICRSLGLVFDAASSGHNPLVDVWDKSEYAVLVGSHTCTDPL